MALIIVVTDESMKNHTSFKIGGPADVFIAPKSEEERLAEKIVEELEKYPSQEEEKNKINIKK